MSLYRNYSNFYKSTHIFGRGHKIGGSEMVAQSGFEKISQPKKLVFIEGGHFGLLEYPSAVFDDACKVQIEFLNNLFGS